MCGKAGLPPCLGAPPPSNYPLCTLPLFPLAFARPMAGVRARADDGYIFTCCTLIVLFLLVKYSPRDNQSIEKRGMVCSECVLQMASQATLTALMSGSVYASLAYCCWMVFARFQLSGPLRESPPGTPLLGPLPAPPTFSRNYLPLTLLPPQAWMPRLVAEKVSSFAQVRCIPPTGTALISCNTGLCMAPRRCLQKPALPT